VRIFGYIFYSYIWVSFNIWLGYFYRFNKRKHTRGLENVPLDKPVIFCSNHPNAFMDAIMAGSALNRRTWFLARSDVFRKKWLANFLSFIGIIPIYRLLEGAENLQKNDETFDKCAELLEQKKAIIIFSEGLCIQERRLRKLKKGTARIAFGSEEKNNFNLGLMIVPVGVNYSATPWKFRSPLYIEYGEPFEVAQYKELYQQDKPRAMNVFTRDLEERMKKLLMVIESRENDELVNGVEEMLLKDWCEKAGLDPENRKESILVSKQIAEVINHADKHEPERVAALREKVPPYISTLKKMGLRDWLLRPQQINAMGIGSLLSDFLFFFLLFPFWLFGVITNYLPYKIPYLLAEKVVKNIEWHASINGTLAVFLYQIFWGLESLAVALIFRDWWILIAFIVAMPLCGMIAQEYWVRMKKSKGKANLIKAFKADRNKVQELIETREEIVSEMESLRSKVSETQTSSHR
jgi:glycerol-3-phosphate O-acyltransferase / dihydroxyacetone phosphate acyltransferase